MPASDSGFDRSRAELFEALGHPTRIRILKALSASDMSFSDLKRSVGIDSNGLLSFHLSKLSGLIRTTEAGLYALTDEGKEALRTTSYNEKESRIVLSPKFKKEMKLALLVSLIFSFCAIGWQYDAWQSSNDMEAIAISKFGVSSLDLSVRPGMDAAVVEAAINLSFVNPSSRNIELSYISVDVELEFPKKNPDQSLTGIMLQGKCPNVHLSPNSSASAVAAVSFSCQNEDDANQLLEILDWFIGTGRYCVTFTATSGWLGTPYFPTHSKVVLKANQIHWNAP
uniref:ArsR family transcriptional regulator n=1 Tax=Candidatus Methanomethylicus mesodigestus TaxID=1867258 RepID=A0A7C3J442_9CREN